MRLSRLPVVTAALALDLSLVPTLLPRPVWVQGLISGLVAAQAYALAVAMRAMTRPALAAAGRRVGWRPTERVRRRADRGLLVALALLLGVAVVAGHAGQARLATGMGLARPPLAGQVAAAALALLVGALLVVGFRGAAALVRRGWPVRRATAWLLVPVLGLGGCVGVAPRPAAAVRSGAADSLVSWGSLGRKGQEFVSGGPDARAITAVTRRPARNPVRVYVGLASAPTPTERARLALRELERTGAFDRATLVVIVPTGSGWVNPAAPAALEYLGGGDVASVAMQYSSAPSWLAYLRGVDDVRVAARTLLQTVRDRWLQLPAERRPRLLVYGESLGALGGLSAYASLNGAATPADGALWVGVPSVADDRTIPAAPPSARVRTIVHPEDPVAAWSPRLLARPTPDWPRRWYPLVTFWQATADMAATYWTPTGHGHRYAAELVDAWRAVAAVDGAVPADRLPAVRAAVVGSHSSNAG